MLLLTLRSACRRMSPRTLHKRQAGCSLSRTLVPCLQEEVWLNYLRKVMHLAREADVEDSSSGGDSSGGSGGSGSAGQEGEVSLEDFEVGRGVCYRQLLRSAWVRPTAGCCGSCCQADPEASLPPLSRVAAAD